MKLLFITRKIDAADPRTGFLIGWIQRLARRVDQLIVLTWQPSSTADLPPSVKIISLSGSTAVKIIRFQLELFKIIRGIDGIFCHMNPEYTILAGPMAKLFRKKIVSWYTHGTVSVRVRGMEKFVDVVVSASEKSFRLPSKKLRIIGHGINTQQFSPAPSPTVPENFRLLTVGRISPTKDYESMIKALDILGDSGVKNITLTIVGAPALSDQQAYFDSLQQMAQKMGLTERVEFVGAVPHTRIPEYLRQHDAFINLSGTGSLDKALLEAMAAGCIPLTSNDAFSELLPADLLVKSNDPHGLAAKIRWLALLPITKRQELQRQLRSEVIQHHNLDTLIGKIVAQFEL